MVNLWFSAPASNTDPTSLKRTLAMQTKAGMWKKHRNEARQIAASRQLLLGDLSSDAGTRLLKQ